MKPENKAFLDEHLHQFINLERAFYVRGLMVHVREGMNRVMREEFNPRFEYCGTCDNDVANMVRTLYRCYHDWLKAENNDTNQYRDISEGITEMNKLSIEPVSGDPVKVSANFPAHRPQNKVHIIKKHR